VAESDHPQLVESLHQHFGDAGIGESGARATRSLVGDDGSERHQTCGSEALAHCLQQIDGLFLENRLGRNDFD